MSESPLTTIEGLENARYAAMQDKDLSALDILLHDDLTYVHSSGDVDTKHSYLTGLRDGNWTYRRVDRANQTIKVHGSLALVFCQLSISLVARGEARELDNLALAVWTKDGDEWKLIAVQSGIRPV